MKKPTIDRDILRSAYFSSDFTYAMRSPGLKIVFGDLLHQVFFFNYTMRDDTETVVNHNSILTAFN